MKKIFYVLFLTGFLLSCGTNLKNAYKLSPGMSKEQVVAVLGTPAVNDFDRNVEEWHYCDYMGNFIALYFIDGTLIAKTSYTVTEYDRQGEMGNCAFFARKGNYRVPDKVIEIRNIYRIRNN